jgi:hypothetical protein
MCIVDGAIIESGKLQNSEKTSVSVTTCPPKLGSAANMNDVKIL